MNVSKQSSIATRLVSFESAINRLFNCVCIVIFACIMWLHLRIIQVIDCSYVRALGN